MDELERELLSMVTRELGELRIMVCRSKLCSESGEMGKGRFLLGRDVSRGLGKREPAGEGSAKGYNAPKKSTICSFCVLLGAKNQPNS